MRVWVCGFEIAYSAAFRSCRVQRTVVGVQQRDGFLVMTFDVDRVWKGSASKRVVLYRPIPRPGDRFPGQAVWNPFVMGGCFIVLAHLLNAEERAEFGVDAGNTRSLATSMCGDGSRPYSIAEEHGEVKEMGPGRELQETGEKGTYAK
jgi:hypothetical protein